MSEIDGGLLPALDQLRTRWRLIVGACSISVALALGVSLLLTKKYTAVSRIVIDPPAGSDPRSSMAVSPIYLESLRSYELFASSDDLFLQAVQRFGLRDNSLPIDNLKKSVLKAEMPRNTKILEIQATLPDPKTAHALALYIAEETVKLSQAVSRGGDEELSAVAGKQLQDAQTHLQTIEQAWIEASRQAQVEPLRVEIESDRELRTLLQRELAESDVLFPEGDARIERYRGRLQELERKITEKEKLLAERSTRMEQLSFERNSAQAAVKTAESRLQETHSALALLHRKHK